MNKDIEVIIETLSGKAEVQVITIKGTIDVVTSKDVDEKVLPIIEKGDSNIILDLSNVVYLSSTGMMCLIRYFVYANAKECILKLVRPPNHVYHTLQITGIAKHFNIFDRVEDALEKLM